MIKLGWKNLIHDKGRLAVTLVGVTFAVVLMLVQSGIYFGFLNSVSQVIDHCPADLWIVAAKTVNTDTAAPFSEDDFVRVKATPGIAWAERMTWSWGFFKLSTGANVWGQIIGFNPATGIGGPWEMVRGTIADVKKPGTYIVDEMSLPLIGGASVGDRLENLSRKMEIVGVCRGARSYNTYPVMFTSFQTAQDHSTLHDERLSFIVAKLEATADRGATIQRLRWMKNFDVYTRAEFSRKNRSYWATKTGVGIGIGTTIVLGFIVGLIIVGQTMYAATVERIHEYATLKALGATNFDVCRTIWFQALVAGLGGYTIGALLTLAVKITGAGEAVAVDLRPSNFVVMFGTTLVMCFAASLVSILRVLKVDPATVFRS